MNKTDGPVDPGEKNTVPVCGKCGSHLVMRDAWAIWNYATGLWELGPTFDATFCDECGVETNLTWLSLADWRTRRIRALNDQLRQGKLGPNDRFVATSGVVANGEAFATEALQKVFRFTAFGPENDPKGEHDFGIVQVGGQSVYFKIDYYSPDLRGGSEDPAEPLRTARVLTVLLASEY
jgi:Protein of unknown function (DUF3768)